MTLPWHYKQRHRGCLGLDPIEVRLPLRGVSYGHGNTTTQPEAAIPMTRKSLRDDAIELDHGDQRLYVPYMRLYFYAVAMLLHVFSERSFAPAAEHKIWTALLWRWGTSIMWETHTIGCYNLAGRGAYYVYHVFSIQG